jgi:hypothetical protein
MLRLTVSQNVELCATPQKQRLARTTVVAMSPQPKNVDYSLVRRLIDGFLCTSCLKQGVRTPVRSMLSTRHRVQSLCPKCRAERWGQTQVRFTDSSD